MPKTARKKMLWERIALSLFGAGAIFVLIFALGIFLWMRSWKTLDFPDNQATISYPGEWTLKLKPADLSKKINRDAWNFAEIRDIDNFVDSSRSETISISFVRYLPSPNTTDDQDALVRLKNESERFNLSERSMKLGNLKVYWAENNTTQDFYFGLNGYVYQINAKNSGVLPLFFKTLVLKIIGTMTVNSAATKNLEFSNIYK